MESVSEIEGTLNSLSVHLGAVQASGRWAEQHFQKLQTQFDNLAGELSANRSRTEQLEADNETLKAQLRANGIVPRPFEHRQQKIETQDHREEGEVSSSPPLDQADRPSKRQRSEQDQHTTLSHAFTCLDRPTTCTSNFAQPITYERRVIQYEEPYTNQPDERRPICTYCWQTRSKCDKEPQCETCVEREVTCVRMLCEGGYICGRPRCPRLHPSQYDVRDDGWVVQEGRMPEEQGVEVPIESDNYP